MIDFPAPVFFSRAVSPKQRNREDDFSDLIFDPIWIADAHRDDGKRFVVHADEKLTAFLELERAVCIHLLTEQI
jgi:hypothetical protein